MSSDNHQRNAVYHATSRRARDLPITPPASFFCYHPRQASFWRCQLTAKEDTMPKTSRNVQPRSGELPGHAAAPRPRGHSETFSQAHDSAVQAYGEGTRPTGPPTRR